VISADASRVTVRVIPTDEDVMIARSVDRILGLGMAGAKSGTKGTL
jgi:acetate kinase